MVSFVASQGRVTWPTARPPGLLQMLGRTRGQKDSAWLVDGAPWFSAAPTSTRRGGTGRRRSCRAYRGRNFVRKKESPEHRAALVLVAVFAAVAGLLTRRPPRTRGSPTWASGSCSMVWPNGSHRDTNGSGGNTVETRPTIIGNLVAGRAIYNTGEWELQPRA